MSRKIDMKRYDPAVHTLPPNRATRLAMRSHNRQLARKQQRELARHGGPGRVAELQARLTKALEPWLGKPVTDENKQAIVDAVCGVMGKKVDRATLERELKPGHVVAVPHVEEKHLNLDEEVSRG